MSPEPSSPSQVEDVPLTSPVPGREFKHLDRRQSIIVWALGSLIGVGLAIAALLIFAPQWI